MNLWIICGYVFRSKNLIHTGFNMLKHNIAKLLTSYQQFVEKFLCLPENLWKSVDKNNYRLGLTFSGRAFIIVERFCGFLLVASNIGQGRNIIDNFFWEVNKSCG